MGSDLNITKHLQNYILKHGLKLHPVQKEIINYNLKLGDIKSCLLYTSPSPRDLYRSRMPSSA